MNSLDHQGTIPRATPRQDETQAKLSTIRLLRLRNVLEIIPISKSAWYAGVSSGLFPAGHYLGPRVKVWRSDEIDAVVQSVCKEAG